MNLQVGGYVAGVDAGFVGGGVQLDFIGKILISLEKILVSLEKVLISLRKMHKIGKNWKKSFKKWRKTPPSPPPASIPV